MLVYRPQKQSFGDQPRLTGDELASVRFFLAAFVVGAPAFADPGQPAVPAPEATAAHAASVKKVLARARQEVERAVRYDGRWVSLAYPGGDVPADTGVCTDVAIRGFRAAGLDLQRLVHEDILRAPEAYERWVKRADASIDHRRVAPLDRFLKRHARALSIEDPKAYEAGDVVILSFNPCPACSPQHIGIVSDRKGPRGLPLMLHNLGPSPSEDDTLDAWTRLAHYRVLP